MQANVLSLDEPQPEVAAGLARARAGKLRTLMDAGRAYEAIVLYSSAAQKYGEAMSLASTDDINEALRRARLYATSSAVASRAAVGDYEGATKKVVESDVNPRDLTIDDGPARFGLRAYWLRAQLLHWFESGLLVFLGLILLVLIGAFVRRFFRRGLVIEPFSEDSLDRKVGSGFTLAVEGELARLMAEDSEVLGGVRVESPVQSDLSMPTEIAGALPGPIGWVQALPHLLGQVLARRTLRVSGVLHYSSLRGAGVSVRIAKAGSVIASHTFWESVLGYPSRSAKEQPDESAFLRVAGYAAICVAFQLGRRQKKDFELLGTRDWRAYVFFRRGVNAEGAGDSEVAKTYFVQALSADPDMQCARFNRARLAPKERYQLTLEALERAADNSKPNDPTHYKARYTLAFRLHETGHPEKALTHANRLYDEAYDQLFRKDLLRRARGPTDEVFRSFLEFVFYGFAVPLKIGLDLALNDDIGKLGEAEDAQRKTATGHASYMFGCVYAQAARVVSLTHSTTGKPSASEEDATSSGDRPDIRTRLEYLEMALLALEIAVQLEPSLAAAVETDSTLDELRRAGDNLDGVLVSDRFEKIWTDGTPTGSAPPATSRLALAQLSEIGDEHAATLEKQGVTSTDNLILRARTDAEHRKISQTLGIPIPQVLRWAQTADMMRIVGLEVPGANLLNAAGVFSLKDLANADEARSRSTCASGIRSSTTQPPLPPDKCADGSMTPSPCRPKWS